MKALAAALALVAALPAAAAPPSVMPFGEVRVGMRGEGRTAFAGRTVESFAVEIIGKLPRIGPDQDLILGRCSGGPLAETGVLSGMSGSPVFVDGRLIGAIAYSWGFSKEAIAGITPIGEMLEIARGATLAARAPIVGPTPADLRELAASPGALRERLGGPLFRLAPRPAGVLPSSIPVAIAGLGAAGLARIAPDLERAGLLALQSGGGGPDSASAPPLEPGSPIGVKLVRGDLEFTATGTVTWVDGDDVLAFGHPLFGLGEVDLPMTGANVETLLPSLQQSARIATPTAEIGALRQDRASGVLGRRGVRPRMIPVRFTLAGSTGQERTYSFDIADDPLLSPLLLYVSLNGIVASRERTIGTASVRLREGSVLKMAEGEDVALDNLFAGPDALELGTGIPAYVLYLLMNNTWSRPAIAGVNLLFEYETVPRSARVRRVSLDRYQARAGETVEASVVLRPFRGPDRLLTRKVRIPEETLPGTLTLHVGGAATLMRAEARDEPLLPRDLEQLVALINQLRRNDRVYLAATREDTGVLLDGARLPNLPPAVVRVLGRPEGRGNLTPLRRRSVLEESIDTGLAVEGATRIELEVVAP